MCRLVIEWSSKEHRVCSCLRQEIEMIPKKVNYIWLGGGKKSNFTNMCIVSWCEHLPDYEIIEWNESNLDLDKLCQGNRFLAECRKRKLWAFMADYLRLYVLYNYGGIYFDTDVQVLKSFDDLLDNHGFIGMEYFSKDTDGVVTEGTGVIASEAGNPVIKECLDYYSDRIWETDVYYIPTIFSLVLQGKSREDFRIYDVNYFAPYDYLKSFKKECIAKDTLAIHWFSASWHENKNIGLFLKTKHIKNPVKKKLVQFINLLKYYKHKMGCVLRMLLN